uniref:Uncharacterized protein LOC100182590 n=1 Tax=Phallusia mammillata TaxID=59560 RepID=A0A6F9DH02_9ASCI|nr:uncharacterized protein LOC100182590 [Phallusia mammillata]
MSQTGQKRNAKKQCNMSDVSMLQESTTPRIQYSPRDAKESKFSLRQTNIYSSPVVYQHAAGKFQSNFHNPLTALLPVSRHYLSDDVVKCKSPQTSTKTKNVVTKSKLRQSTAEANKFVDDPTPITFLPHENDQFSASCNFKKTDFSNYAYPQTKLEDTSTKRENVNFETFVKTKKISKSPVPQQIKNNIVVPESGSQKELKNFLSSITSLLNLSEDELQEPEEICAVHEPEPDYETLLMLNSQTCERSKEIHDEELGCHNENVQPYAKDGKPAKPSKLFSTIHAPLLTEKPGQCQLRTHKLTRNSTRSKYSLKTTVKPASLTTKTILSKSVAPVHNPDVLASKKRSEDSLKTVRPIHLATDTFSSKSVAPVYNPIVIVTKHVKGDFIKPENKDHEYSESVQCEVTSDDEDDLITSLDHFLHSGTNHASSLGTSLRLMRVYQRIKGQNAKGRERTLIMSRYFQKWKQNTKLQRHSKQQEVQKLKSATSFHSLTLISQHFYAWRFYLLKRKLQAQELHRLHLLSKGLTGLKWFHGKCKERDEWIRCRYQHKLLHSAFTQWKAQYNLAQQSKLKSSFQRWKSQLFQQRTLNQLLDKKKRITLFKSFCTWKLVHENHQVDLMARHVWSVKMKRKILVRLKIYAGACRIQHSHNQTANQQFEHRLLHKTFLRWKESRKHIQAAQCMSNKKILSSWFKNWLYVTKFIKSSRRRQFAVVVQIRQASLIKQFLGMWRRELKLKVFVSESNRTKLRVLFHIWNKSLLLALRKKSVADQHWQKLNLKHNFHAWKSHCDVIKRNRKQACVHLIRCRVIPPFMDWKLFVQKRKLNEKRLQAYTTELNQDICYNAFMTWRAAFNEKLLTIHWYEQWRDACVMQAVKHWKGFVCKRRFYRNHDKLIVQRCFKIWKNEFNHCHEQHLRADKLASIFLRKQVQKMFCAWHSVCQSSKLIQPLARRKERKICARAFDAWRAWIARKQAMESLTCEFTLWRMKQHFMHWRMELDRKQVVCDYLSKKNEYKMKKCLIIWKLRTISLKKSKKRQQHKTQVVVECFDRWREVAYDQRMITEDSLSWFRKVHDRETKLVALKCWKQSLMYKRFAHDLLAMKQQHLLSKIFKEWKNMSKLNFQIKMANFTDRLHTSNYTISSFSNSSIESCEDFSHAPESLCNRKTVFNDSGVETAKDSSSEVSSQCDRILQDKEFQSNALIPSSFSPHDTESCDSYDHECRSIISYNLDDDTTYEDSSTNKAHSSNDTMTIAELDSDFDNRTCFGDAENQLLSNRTVVELSCTATTHDNCSVAVHDSALSDHLADMEVESLMQQKATPVEVNADGDVNFKAVSVCELKVDQPVTSFCRRPKLVTDVIGQRTDKGRLSQIASFALHRLKYPTLSLVFYQWKQFVNEKKWKRNAQQLAESFQNEKQKQVSFRKWKFLIISLAVADNHYYQRLFEQTFSSWIHWVRLKKHIKCLHQFADKMIKRRLTSVSFGIWRQNYKQICEFKDALNKLELEQADVKRLEGDCSDFQKKQRNALLKKCMKIWTKKHHQLKLCDRHSEHKLTQRCFLHWEYCTERKQCQRNRVKAVNEILFKYRFLTTWRRMLHQKKMAEFIHADNVKKRMQHLLTHWHRFALVQRKNRTFGEAFLARSKHAKLTFCFSSWKHRSKLQRSAINFHTSNLLRKSFSSLQQFVLEKSARNEMAKIVDKRNSRQLVARCFSRWQEAKNKGEIYRHFEVARLRSLWLLWRRRTENRRVTVERNNPLLRRSFDVWLKRCREEKNARCTTRHIITKWRNLTVKQRQLQEMSELIEIGQRALLKETTFNRWIENCVQSIEAKRHFRRTQLRRFFFAWQSNTFGNLNDDAS